MSAILTGVNISLDTGTDACSETSNMFKPHMMGSMKSDLGQSLFYESNQMMKFSLEVHFNYTCTQFDVRQRSFLSTTLGEIIKTYGVGRSFVTSPKDVKKNELDGFLPNPTNHKSIRVSCSVFLKS